MPAKRVPRGTGATKRVRRRQRKKPCEDLEPTSKELRDQGMALVLANEKRAWREAAYVYIAKLPYGLHMTGEDIRVKYFVECDPGKPHHPNVWGAVINVCLQRGFLEKTGKFVKSKTPKRHANEVPVLLTGAWKKSPNERRKE